MASVAHAERENVRMFEDVRFRPNGSLRLEIESIDVCLRESDWFTQNDLVSANLHRSESACPQRRHPAADGALRHQGACMDPGVTQGEIGALLRQIRVAEQTRVT